MESKTFVPHLRFIVSAKSKQEDKETLRDFHGNLEFIKERVLLLHPALGSLLIVSSPERIKEYWPFRKEWGRDPQESFHDFLEHVWTLKPPVAKGEDKNLAGMFQG